MKFLFKRIIIAIPIFLGITIIVFTLSNLAPGGPVDTLASSGHMTVEEYNQLIVQYGLDKPVCHRYLIWLGNLLRGNFGISYRTNQPVWELISERCVPSLILTGSGFILAILISIPLGTLSAYKPYSVWDNLASAVAFIGSSTPSFFISLVCIYFFAVKLKLLPVLGMYTSGGSGNLGDLLYHLILPSFIIMIQLVGPFIKQTRGSVLEVMNEDYVKTARSKGISEGRVMMKHALRNAWTPIITTMGLQIPFLIGGAVVTEQIFSWPGLGTLMLLSINARDYNTVMGVTVLISVVVLAANILLDLLYSVLDPRIKHS